MNVIDYCHLLLNTNKIEEKLLAPECVDDFSLEKCREILEVPKVPGRPAKLVMSEKRVKFPKASSFGKDEAKGKALHFFANHELLAIEMMAAALMKFSNTIDPKMFAKIAKGIFCTLRDEQKHLKLYMDRMNDFGVSFGDFPVNDFFWRRVNKMKSFTEYFSLISLTFEAANLDFCKYYGALFSALEDIQTAEILDQIYKDEVSHVDLGVYWLNNWRQDKTLWSYYHESLPSDISPARGKGIEFSPENRMDTLLDSKFIDNLNNYKDNFKITQRRL